MQDSNKKDKNEFMQEAILWVDKNKNKRFQNEDVDMNAYNKLLERKNAGKTTNIGAIRNVDKLFKYYHAAKMLGITSVLNDIEHIIQHTNEDILLKKMFQDVTYESPSIKIVKATNIKVKNNNIIAEINGKTQSLCFKNQQYEHRLLPKAYQDSQCWHTLETSKKAYIGQIELPVDWLVYGEVFLDKTCNEYKINIDYLVADYQIPSDHFLVGRYSGLNHTAWISFTPLATKYDCHSTKEFQCYENKDWVKDGHPECSRGVAYLYNSNFEKIASLKCYFDGYNNLNFEQFAELLNSAYS